MQNLETTLLVQAIKNQISEKQIQGTTTIENPFLAQGMGLTFDEVYCNGVCLEHTEQSYLRAILAYLRNLPLLNPDPVKVTGMAMVCHEALRGWCEVNGDHTQEIWMNSQDWQKDAIKAGVKFLLENPGAGHDATHNAWMEKKIADGWVYGPVKDAEAKTHPCIVPFEQLSEFERKKDELICAIVNILK